VGYKNPYPYDLSLISYTLPVPLSTFLSLKPFPITLGPSDVGKCCESGLHVVSKVTGNPHKQLRG
jgi:hypothetical protein